jgi:hypothetical protein
MQTSRLQALDDKESLTVGSDIEVEPGLSFGKRK